MVTLLGSPPDIVPPSGSLSNLTASGGQSLHITYNTAGLISTITDSAGRVTTYGYDAGNQYLTWVENFAGRVTGYSYNTATGGINPRWNPPRSGCGQLQ